MKLRVVALGHRMPAWVSAGWDEYARRLPREFALELVALKPESRDGSKPIAALLAAEAGRIVAACKDALVVALDERGRGWTTRELADRLARWRDDARDVAFVIGSADGLADSIKRDAAAVVALSRRSRCRTASSACCSPSSSIGRRASSPATRIIGTR